MKTVKELYESAKHAYERYIENARTSLKEDDEKGFEVWMDIAEDKYNFLNQLHFIAGTPKVPRVLSFTIIINEVYK